MILLFSPSPNVFYYTGYTGNGILLLYKNKKYLFVPDMEMPNIKGIKLIKSKGIPLLKHVTEFVKKNKIQKIEIEDNISVKLLKNLKKNVKVKFKFIEIDRKIKKKEELKKIKRACRITDKIFKRLNKDFKFKTELELKNWIVNEIRKKGCLPSFEPIIASGKGSSIPHYEGNKKLVKGFLIIDFGVRYKGYCSDMTRTIYLGKPTKKEEEWYNLVLKSQNNAIKNIKPKINCADLMKFIDNKVKNKMTHSLGHGIGIEVHEPPGFGKNSKDILKKGMCICIEPGYYDKYGIRIEDVVYVDNKAIVLTKSIKKLIKQKF